MPREELSEIDRRIAESVARGEAAVARQQAAVARQEAAVARQEELKQRYEDAVARQQEATARIEATSVGFAEQGRLIAEIRVLNAEIVTELREGRDERRAVLEWLMRVLDRLPPAKESG